MAIDRADWHWDSALELYREKNNFKGDINELSSDIVNKIWFYAANHIGLFVKWIIENGFMGEDADLLDCEKVINGEMMGIEYFMKHCDGKLCDEDVAEEILPFIVDYYGNNKYYRDYEKCCLNEDDKPCFGIISDNDDYLKLKEEINKAFKEYKK